MQDTQTPFDPVAYVAAAAPLLGLWLSAEEQARVAAEFAAIAAIARPVLQRDLPPTEQPAPMFQP